MFYQLSKQESGQEVREQFSDTTAQEFRDDCPLKLIKNPKSFGFKEAAKLIVKTFSGDVSNFCTNPGDIFRTVANLFDKCTDDDNKQARDRFLFWAKLIDKFMVLGKGNIPGIPVCKNKKIAAANADSIDYGEIARAVVIQAMGQE